MAVFSMRLGMRRALDDLIRFCQEFCPLSTFGNNKATTSHFVSI
ncbi:hypothetical protein OAD67_02425 [bacterium]|nr:hypothetical protein [bacterium]